MEEEPTTDGPDAGDDIPETPNQREVRVIATHTPTGGKVEYVFDDPTNCEDVGMSFVRALNRDENWQASAYRPSLVEIENGEQA